MRTTATVRRSGRRAVDVIARIVPVGGMVLVGAYIAAQQAVSPQRRMVKLTIALGLVAMMFRFDMAWSIYVFTLLYPFPSGISIGSTNLVLMTLIPLVWAVRAASTGTRFIVRTPLDVPIVVFLFAYAVSLFNVDSAFLLRHSATILWRQFACLAYFYLIVGFINDEHKLMRLLGMMSLSVGFVMLTAVVEMFLPGRTIIPGWISLQHLQGQGRLGFRLEGVRVGGAVGSHSVLSDMASGTLGITIYLVLRAKNPITRTFWFLVSAMTFTAMLSAANRGAFVASLVGLGVAVWVFRRQVSPLKMGLILGGSSAAYLLAESLLEKYTFAASVTKRLLATEFEGVVPENRTMTWAPALKKSLEHIYIGHGPFYNTGEGLTSQYWPHNAYIFYLYTLGLFGLLAFLWIVWRIWTRTRLHAHPVADGTNLGNVLKLLRVWFVMTMIAQLRTDHQRDDIYPFFIWLLFGLIAATARIIEMRAAEVPGGPRPDD